MRIFLEGNKYLLVHGRNLCRESRDCVREMHDGRAVTLHGCLKIRNQIHYVLVDVPTFQVCGGVVRSSVGGAHLFLKQEAPLPVGYSKKHFEMGQGFVAPGLLVPLPTIHRENDCVENKLLGVVCDLIV